jgi:hypothetical protein
MALSGYRRAVSFCTDGRAAESAGHSIRDLLLNGNNVLRNAVERVRPNLDTLFDIVDFDDDVQSILYTLHAT